jgi:hypothetical protein
MLSGVSLICPTLIGFPHSYKLSLCRYIIEAYLRERFMENNRPRGNKFRN